MNVTAKKSGSRADNIMVPLKVSTNMPKIISVKHTRSPPDYALFLGNLYIAITPKIPLVSTRNPMLHANPIRAPIGWKKQYTPTKSIINTG